MGTFQCASWALEANWVTGISPPLITGQNLPGIAIDPIFYGSSRPSGISDADLASYATRRVFLDEIFPNVDVVQGQSQVLYTLDLAYYPEYTRALQF